MEEILVNLRKERMELTGKIRKLESFRTTKEWDKLSVSHKQLLDIQLQSMRTYLECLIGRCLDIQCNIDKQETSKEEQEEPIIKVIKIVLNNENEKD